MDDALWRAGGAGGKQNIERMIEGKRGEGDVAGLKITGEVVQGDGPWERSQVDGLVAIGDDHRRRQALQLGGNGGGLGQTIVALGVVIIAVGGKQDFWFDLAEPVEHPLDAEIRGS